jgi:hypothetical protein
MMLVRNSLLVIAAVAALSTSVEAGARRIRKAANRDIIQVQASVKKESSSLMQEKEHDLAVLFKNENRLLQDMSMSMGGGSGGMDMSMGSGSGGMDMSMSMGMMSSARSKPTLGGPVATLFTNPQVEGDEQTTLIANEPIDVVTGEEEKATSDRAPPTLTEEETMAVSDGDDSAAATLPVGVAVTAMALVYSLLA